MNTNRAEAERLLAIGEKLLQSRDLSGSRDFAILAQEAEPLLDGSDQILAIVDVVVAAEKPIHNNHLDWYAILQVDRTCQDLDLIKKQYRRLGLLLHPDKNPFSLADHAFKLVTDAWAVLSDPVQKALYDRDVAGALPEVPELREDVPRAFDSIAPPLVPGQEAYYCNWGCLPMGFVFGTSGSNGPGSVPELVIENGPKAASNGAGSELGSRSARKREGLERGVSFLGCFCSGQLKSRNPWRLLDTDIVDFVVQISPLFIRHRLTDQVQELFQDMWSGIMQRV
ncbi:hypothetical protein ACSQ67_018179 [Phaseolus vulgaris]